MNAIPITLAVEDELSNVVARKVLTAVGRYSVVATYGRQGNTFLKKKLKAYNSAAAHGVWLVMTDLDQALCPPSLIVEWFGKTKRDSNLLFAVVVREVEAWLLADREGFARFGGMRVASIPLKPEQIQNPKEELIRLMRLSRKRELREDIVPAEGTGRRQGFNYNGTLSLYVRDFWSLPIAQANSASLDRLVRMLREFRR